MVETKEWTRDTLISNVTPTLGHDAFRAQLVSAAPFAGATLLRTIWDAQILVTITSGTHPIPDFGWPSAYLEVRAVWAHDGIGPTIAMNARTRQDIGRVLLRPSYAPSLVESIKNVIIYTTDEVQDVKAQRKAAPDETPAVYLYTYWHDAANSFTGTYDVVATINMQLETLWGH